MGDARVQVATADWSDPIAFARARLDELEVTAKAAADRVGSAKWREAETPDGRSAVMMGDVEHGAHTALVSHFALHDPARALREVEAGRRILARHAECARRGSGPCWEFPYGDGQVCRELADLLYRWPDHDAYHPAWSPREDG